MNIFVFLFAILLAGSASAQVTIPVMVQGNHEAHDYSVPTTQVPLDATLARVVFGHKGKKADALLADDRMEVVVWLSSNGGGFENSYRIVGSRTFTSTSQPEDFEVSLLGPLDTVEPRNAARVLTGRVTLVGSPWRGSVTVEIE